MVPAANLLAFSLAALIIIVLPGPNVLFVIGRALSIGRLHAVLSVAGCSVGMFAQVLVIAAGLGAILEQSVLALTIVKYAGAAFLVYLGVQAIRHRNAASKQSTDATPRRRARSFLEGTVVGVTNPKSVVFFIAVLPQFIDPTSGSVPIQLLELGAIFSALAMFSDSVWAISAGFARDWFGRSPRRLSNLGLAGGVAMVGLGVGLAATGTSKH